MKPKAGGNGSEHNRRRHAERMRQFQHERMRQFQQEVVQPRYNHSGEADVVPTYQLAAALREWSRRWLAADKGFPVDHLAEATGIDQRQITRITNEEYITTSLTLADKLLVAIGQQHLLGWDIQVVPNPNWPLERWLAYQEEMKGDCC